MSDNIFFKYQGPFTIIRIIEICGSKSHFDLNKTIKINNITDLFRAKTNDISFLNSAKYKNQALKTKGKLTKLERKLQKKEATLYQLLKEL